MIVTRRLFKSYFADRKLQEKVKHLEKMLAETKDENEKARIAAQIDICREEQHRLDQKLFKSL
jgi:hypothetical protein